MKKLLLLALVSTASVFAVSSPALAWFKVCNKATEKVYVAIAYAVNDAWHSKGWWPLAVGECSTVIDGESLPNRYYYVHVHGENGRSWGNSDYQLCTIKGADFELKNAESCSENKGELRNFSEVNTEDYDHFTWMIRN